jgi:uncharacterized protein (DUF4415 family)
MQAKYLTLSNGRKILLNTPKEDAAINAAIAGDPDTYELGAAEFKQLRRGRPLGSGNKMQVTLRLDIDVVEKLKAEGAGWQTRANAVLRRSVMRSAKGTQKSTQSGTQAA